MWSFPMERAFTYHFSEKQTGRPVEDGANLKGFFVIRERPFLFPVNCEMANFFLVKRDLVTEP